MSTNDENVNSENSVKLQKMNETEETQTRQVNYSTPGKTKQFAPKIIDEDALQKELDKMNFTSIKRWKARAM